jgi:hypothetical protein
MAKGKRSAIPTTPRSPYDKRMQQSRQNYIDALDRLIRGVPRSTRFQQILAAGKRVQINVSSVAKEAGQSRNPLYQHYPDIVAKIEKVGAGNNQTAKVATARDKIAELREKLKGLTSEKAAALTRNLGLSIRIEKVNEANERLERDKKRLTKQLSKVVGLGDVTDTGSVGR